MSILDEQNKLEQDIDIAVQFPIVQAQLADAQMQINGLNNTVNRLLVELDDMKNTVRKLRDSLMNTNSIVNNGISIVRAVQNLGDAMKDAATGDYAYLE